MKIYFENIAPFERRVELDLQLFNIIQYKNSNISLALQRTLNLLGAGDYTGWESTPMIHTDLGQLKRFMLDPSKPVKVGIDRGHVYGRSQADFTYTWDDQLNHAVVSEFKIRFNKKLVYHRKAWEAKLFVNGLTDFIASRNLFLLQESQKSTPEERQRDIDAGYTENMDLYNQVKNLPDKIYTITVNPDEIKEIPFSHIYPSGCFSFFNSEAQREFNSEIVSALSLLSYDVPYGTKSHWFRFDLKKALSFAELKLDTSYNKYKSLEEPEVQTYLKQLCKYANIPVPKFELVLDHNGTFIGRRFTVVNEKGVKQNIADLSNEEQAIYYLVCKLSLFGYWTYDGLSYYDDVRIIDLSGLENFLSLDELFFFMVYVKYVFTDFRFLLTTKNNFVLRAFSMWTKQQGLFHLQFNIYRFKNNETNAPIEKLTLRSDYEINFATIDTHYGLRMAGRYN